ncbi:hypothetical protein KIP88_02630 [Bradyrhizobium sp. SRL28]|uniref:hypothetical protein n=1 Tax=Bradyrhizobium sp. SRL28 TaxID=2836178 RepID=UPI001BDF2F4E|nr:hypothetical protein [Bradyrhizobium sp. SRL28]MBT1509386.1 hypothetical protein [Bradyrhizobium sp. SRL28]
MIDSWQRGVLTMLKSCKIFVTASFIVLLASPALAQTATGTGVGIANSSSQSGAVAVSGQGGDSNVTINGTPATTTSNINQRVSGTQTIKSNPSLATTLTAAGLETCLGSASGMISLAGFGLGGGSTMTDEGCQARLDARTLASFGLKAAAVARLCQRPDIYASMPDICERYRPVVIARGGAAPIVMSSNAGTSGAIRVIDGRDGVEKDCLSYNSAKQKCLHWSGEPPRLRVASVNPTKSIAPAKPRASVKPLAPATAVANSPAVQAIDSATSAQPKKDD